MLPKKRTQIVVNKCGSIDYTCASRGKVPILKNKKILKKTFSKKISVGWNL